jgi:circadian clock protein KaiC
MKKEKVSIRRLPTGVPGLDEILGGGLPEYSFNIIAGSPGGGKTTLAHQIMFANASPERPALFFTVLGEPAIKMLRYQQQYDFFDLEKVGTSVIFINLSQPMMRGDLDGVLKAIEKKVETASPSIVVVDSFRSLMRKARAPSGNMDIETFIQQLAFLLTSWQATTFLIGEYSEREVRNNPVFTVADGLFWLAQYVERNSIVRKLQIIKLRGQAPVPGMHTFRITDAGLQTFPRTFGLSKIQEPKKDRRRLSCGVAELDVMMGGGIPVGDSIIVAGPTGSGKSLLGSNFIAEGLRHGEPGIIAIFEERPGPYLDRVESMGMNFDKPFSEGLLKILYLRPLDLSLDETVHEIVQAVQEIGARRLVIDSLAGLEMALAPGFRTDFRESLYRMIGALTRLGVTIVSTVEVQETFTSFPLSTYAISFLADDIIRLRYVSINGELRKMLMVIKMRGGKHSKEMREYDITDQGIVIGERIKGFSGLISGIPHTDKDLEFFGDPEETK